MEVVNDTNTTTLTHTLTSPPQFANATRTGNKHARRRVLGQITNEG